MKNSVKSLICKGQIFGRLTVVREAEPRVYRGQKYTKFKCRCTCGNVTDVEASSLKRGLTKSCGCLHKEIVTIHGKSSHPLYKVYNNMLDRCYNKAHPAYSNYGGRKIKVCKDWRNKETGLQSFIDWNNSLSKEKQRSSFKS